MEFCLSSDLRNKGEMTQKSPLGQVKKACSSYIFESRMVPAESFLPFLFIYHSGNLSRELPVEGHSVCPIDASKYRELSEISISSLIPP